MRRYPAMYLPEHYTAYFEETAGVTRARVGLEALAKVAKKRGADLRYGTEVERVTARSVELEDGTVIEAVNVIVCCGPRTQQFLKEEDVRVVQTEHMTFPDPSGLPDVYFEVDDQDRVKYGLRDGEKLD